MMKPIARLVGVAEGRGPADFALRGAMVFNSFTAEFAKCDVLVAGGYVAAVFASTDEVKYEAEHMIDAEGKWLVPGFVDAHVHIESSMLCPEEFCALAATCGVTTIIADPHEIANIFGVDGIRYMIEASENALARVFFMLPSCVPASPLEDAAHTLLAKDLAPLLNEPRVIGLGEMMNYPGVLGGAEDVFAKLGMVEEHNQQQFYPFKGLLRDGHAPLVGGRDLQAYAAAGIASDHECTDSREVVERMAAGLAVLLREGSSAKNLLDLVGVITPQTEHLCALCTDDRHADDLLAEGSINNSVRKLVRDGRLDLATVLRLASYNAARIYGLARTGAIAPGFRADFALYSDLENWRPERVWLKGRVVAENGQPAGEVEHINASRLKNSVRLGAGLSISDLQIEDKGKNVRVIELVPHQIMTRKASARLPSSNGLLLTDLEADIVKLAVLERHRGSGRRGLGFVKGMGIQCGAVASTIAHDAHNLIVLGVNDEDMWLAVNTLENMGGGLVVCKNGEVLAKLALPLAGIFSERPVREVAEGSARIARAVESLGLAKGHDPFMTLAFLSLEVIPSLKLIDKGLVDVDKFEFVDLYVD